MCSPLFLSILCSLSCINHQTQHPLHQPSITMPFPYKTVLITGASAGIGKALVDKMIAEQGDDIFIIAAGRSQDSLDALVATHGSSRIATETVDVSDLAALPAWIASVTQKYPALDCVIFNAGFQQSMDFTKSDTIPLDQVTAEITTNYTSPVHTTALLLPHLLAMAPKPVSLVYVTSGLALIPIQRCPNYCATKAALHSFLFTLRSQMEDHEHVRVIEVIPPAVQTGLHKRQGLPTMGMPLADFINETWAGLLAEKDEIMPDSLRQHVGKIDDVKKAVFKGFNERIKAAVAAAQANAGQ
ncbi:short-chain dehydrogenase [Ophiostoma piceae UAMH 11346]|uniref:Short-chain dehydrogenase n=1 Tax=Ophiostoma piceae (strain UAMH 11346) TaxID=1262450 RepID=S3BTD6_OPHP1|nr:short-chain dehydrogenase [Ophiostoma piceae UAMH 11346]